MIKKESSLNLCIDCFQIFTTTNKKAKRCSSCIGSKSKRKKEALSNLKYKNRFCDRCDNKFRTLMKRPKICPNCRDKPYPNIFS